MRRNLILAAGLFACLIPAGTLRAGVSEDRHGRGLSAGGRPAVYRGSGHEVQGADAPLRVAAAAAGQVHLHHQGDHSRPKRAANCHLAGSTFGRATLNRLTSASRANGP